MAAQGLFVFCQMRLAGEQNRDVAESNLAFVAFLDVAFHQIANTAGNQRTLQKRILLFYIRHPDPLDSGFL